MLPLIHLTTSHGVSACSGTANLCQHLMQHLVPTLGHYRLLGLNIINVILTVTCKVVNVDS